MDDLTGYEILNDVISLASEQSGILNIVASMAIDQELGMSGGDVEDFTETLAKRYGDLVWNWPWQRFACLDEGMSSLFPFALTWQLLTWPFRGSISYPSPYGRLELQHIAKVLAQGHWIDP